MTTPDRTDGLRERIAKIVCCREACILEGCDPGCIALSPEHPLALETADLILAMEDIRMTDRTDGDGLRELIREYARDLRRNSSGGDGDYPWEWAKATADYLEILLKRTAPPKPAPDALREATALELLRKVEFGCPQGRCPYCLGWDAETDSSRPNVHTTDCKLAAALSAPVQSGAATSPVKPDRETLIHTICPHIRQYSDSHWQGNHACLQCPATVKIPQGDAVQRCRRDAEGAADDVIRCWQSTGDQPTPQVSASALARMTEALEFLRDGYANQDVNHVDYRVKVYQVALDALGDAAADRTPAVVLQDGGTP